MSSRSLQNRSDRGSTRTATTYVALILLIYQFLRIVKASTNNDLSLILNDLVLKFQLLLHYTQLSSQVVVFCLEVLDDLHRIVFGLFFCPRCVWGFPEFHRILLPEWLSINIWIWHGHYFLRFTWGIITGISIVFYWFCARIMLVLTLTPFRATVSRQWWLTSSFTCLSWNSSFATFVVGVLYLRDETLNLRWLTSRFTVLFASLLRRSAITLKGRISCHKLTTGQARGNMVLYSLAWKALHLLCFEYVNRFLLRLFANIEGILQLKEWR